VQARQYFVVQLALRPLVNHLVLRHTLALQNHQAAGQFSASLGVQQPLSGSARNFDLFLRV
jgi:hypothetical protein